MTGIGEFSDWPSDLPSKFGRVLVEAMRQRALGGYGFARLVYLTASHVSGGGGDRSVPPRVIPLTVTLEAHARFGGVSGRWGTWVSLGSDLFLGQSLTTFRCLTKIAIYPIYTTENAVEDLVGLEIYIFGQ